MDDDPVNQMVIQAMLGKAGFKVLKAADGQKALDLLEVRCSVFLPSIHMAWLALEQVHVLPSTVVRAGVFFSCCSMHTRRLQGAWGTAPRALLHRGR